MICQCSYFLGIFRLLEKSVFTEGVRMRDCIVQLKRAFFPNLLCVAVASLVLAGPTCAQYGRV